jgi:hypothetical protein
MAPDEFCPMISRIEAAIEMGRKATFNQEQRQALVNAGHQVASLGQDEPSEPAAPEPKAPEVPPAESRGIKRVLAKAKTGAKKIAKRRKHK